MAVNFPQKPDILLKNAPIEEVVCQVRFPPILRISEQDRDPIEFQEEIRAKFPLIEVEHGLLVRIPGVGSGGAPSADVQSKIYRFHTPDKKAAISLAADFYAVATNYYTHWTDFAQHLAIADQAVRRVYNPAFANRIGLRYINRLTPDNTGCRTLPELFEILRPELTVYATNDVWTDPREMRSRLLLTDGDARLNLRTGHGFDGEQQPYFILDFDYFENGQQLPLTDIVQRCERYHNVIYRAFRWCIPDEKLNVFDPIILEEKSES